MPVFGDSTRRAPSSHPLHSPRTLLCSAAVAKRDYYEVLGVPRDADASALKKAYRKLAMQHHPDRNPDDPSAEDRFKEATEAYSVLSDEQKRKRYDRMGHAAFESQGPGGFDPADFGSVSELFEGIFGEMFGRGRRRSGGRDLKYDLTIKFEEAALGTEKTIQVERPGPCEPCGGSGAEPGTSVSNCEVCQGRGQVRQQRGFFSTTRTCSACHGKGKRIETPCRACRGQGTTVRAEEMLVRVPAGVDDGAVRTLRGAGEVAPGGAGDLHITIHVEPHSLFARKGADVLLEVPISFPQAVLGAQVDVPTLEGKVTMKVPPSTQSGRVFRLRGKGIPVYGGAGKGDQLVTVLVEVPERVTRRQRKLIQELADEMGVDTHPQQAGFLDKLRSLLE